jgi:hypothetical protein
VNATITKNKSIRRNSPRRLKVEVLDGLEDPASWDL